MTTVSEYVIERLEKWGIRRIYGYPGDGINGLLGALDKMSDSGARGPIANERLSKREDGLFQYELKRSFNGQEYLVLSGAELLRKLAAFVPPPRCT